MAIKLNEKYLSGFFSEYDKQNLKEIEEKARIAFGKIKDKSGEGGEMLGWADLPENYDKTEFSRILAASEKIRANSDVVIVVGIGGSYLGAKAAIDFIKSPLYNNLKKSAPDIHFLGNSISSDYFNEVVSICENRDFSVIVISKSGTTTEPAIAFRALRGLLEQKYCEGAKDRIFAITDKNPKKSALRALAEKNGYETFVVPDDIGGRYSVLTAVGLLPIAVAGIDIAAIMEGAAKARENFYNFSETNDCMKYAMLRNLFYEKGKSVEIMVSYEPAFVMMGEWWKQLFGESEGKDKKGLFPASVTFSTDLHSLGQFIQDGSRIMFETVINIKESQSKFTIPQDSAKIDGLDYLDGMDLDAVNNKAMLGTIIAHADGGTPSIVIDIDKRDEKAFGELVYFFELACAFSGYILSVNPFNQPGVEAYKINMFALLGNPKYAKEKKEIEKRL
ncbi:MAG: glucose-6-phosphate isomerase [Oscillospiraceae bacterium]|nr:glucose-6-phosphate isomerase [Oscillospiraceae bacterium]